VLEDVIEELRHPQLKRHSEQMARPEYPVV
jgi:hypothetical protein